MGLVRDNSLNRHTLWGFHIFSIPKRMLYLLGCTVLPTEGSVLEIKYVDYQLHYNNVVNIMSTDDKDYHTSVRYHEKI